MIAASDNSRAGTTTATCDVEARRSATRERNVSSIQLGGVLLGILDMAVGDWSGPVGPGQGPSRGRPARRNPLMSGLPLPR